MLHKPKAAVHFGAGNIGRGFIGPLLSQSGYHVVFVDVQDEVVDALNKQDEYRVHILDVQEETVETVSDYSGLKPTVPDTVDAIDRAEIITTSVGPSVLEKVAPTIAQGISKRRTSGRGAVNIIACENMVGATSQLREHILEHLKDKPEDLEYIEQHVGFPNCEVDRIVPQFKGRRLSVGVEGFKEWIVEKKQIKGDLHIQGMELADNLEPFLDRKLYTLNCGHAILAFLGHVKGYSMVRESIEDEDIKGITRAALGESGAALIKKHGFDETEHELYIERTMGRYANPSIDDEVPRVSRNPLRKLSPKERLVGAVEMCKQFGLARDHLLKGIAAAFHFHVEGDEEAVELKKLVKEKGITQAIVETTKFERGSREHETVLREYETLKTWRN